MRGSGEGEGQVDEVAWGTLTETRHVLAHLLVEVYAVEHVLASIFEEANRDGAASPKGGGVHDGALMVESGPRDVVLEDDPQAPRTEGVPAGKEGVTDSSIEDIAHSDPILAEEGQAIATTRMDHLDELVALQPTTER